jgi:hypothetical protein
MCCKSWKKTYEYPASTRKTLNVIREMHTKTTIKHCFTPTRTAATKDRKQPGMTVDTYNPSYSGGRSRNIPNSRPAWVNLARLCPKNKIQTKELGHGQVVECLPSKHEGLVNGWNWRTSF